MHKSEASVWASPTPSSTADIRSAGTYLADFTLHSFRREAKYSMATAAHVTAAERFYAEALRLMNESGVPFLVGGAYAMREYAEIYRDTKDLDVFCKTGDYARLLEVLAVAGYKTELTDAGWLAKACYKGHQIDLIFNSGNRVCPVDDTWFEHAIPMELFGCAVKLIPPEEELWSKLLVQDRYRFDGADVLHIIRKSGQKLDWKRLLMRMEPHWEVLLAQLLTFRFVYPAERDIVPRWLMDELLARAVHDLDMPSSKERLCRGRLLSRTQYEVDVNDWGYKPF